MEPRNLIVNARVTPAERQALDVLSRTTGQTKSNLIRSACLAVYGWTPAFANLKVPAQTVPAKNG